jgi:Arc/MetJ-type ribon-helix-helix transcriptional regulator
MSRLKTVHVILTPQISKLLDAEVSSGRFANVSEALRNAAWKAFAHDPMAQLQDAFTMLDVSDQPAPDTESIVNDIRAFRRSARKRRNVVPTS